MSLPFRERRQLRALGRAAVRDDMDLAVAFALFNHARKDEEMPFTERLRARAVRRRLRAERMSRAEWADWPDDTCPIFGPDLPLPGLAASPPRRQRRMRAAVRWILLTSAELFVR